MKGILIIKEKTFKIRYYITKQTVRLLTPKLYENYVKEMVFEEELNRVPRPTTLEIHKRFGDAPLIGAEIGVGYGFNAENILKILNMKRLYCVDPLTSYLDGESVLRQFSAKAAATINKLAVYENVIFIKDSSVNAAKKIIEPLDFVYIDACHEYKHVYEDMSIWYPLVKRGGIMGGHDLIIFKDVWKALIDFCASKLITPKFAFPDWIIYK